MERQLDAYKLPRYMYPSKYDRFRYIGGIGNTRRIVLATATLIGGNGISLGQYYRIQMRK